MNGKTVKAHVLVEYLQMPKQSFQSWIRRGLFGEAQRKQGAGRERTFTYEEVLFARILRDLVDLTKVRELALLFGAHLAVAEDLRSSIHDLVERPLRHFPSPKGTVTERTWLLFSWRNGELVISPQVGEAPQHEPLKKKAGGKAVSFIAIPFLDLANEVSDDFDQRAE